MKLQNVLMFLLENTQLTTLGAVFIGIKVLDEMYFKPATKPGSQKKKNKKDRTLKCGKIENVSGIFFGESSKKGKYIFSPAEAEGHVLVTGGSGSGKTSCILINTLRSWAKNNTKNTIFCIDISGDIEPNCDIPNKLVYEPRNPNSLPYNIFGYIDGLPTDDEKVLALDKLAEQIVGITEEGATDAGSYYKDSALALFQGILIAYYFDGKDFIEICSTINKNNCYELLNDITTLSNEEAESRIEDLLPLEDIILANIKQTLGRKISIFLRDPYLKKNIRRPVDGELAFEPEAIETYNCFINIPDEDLTYYRQLTQVLTSQTLNFFKGRRLNAESTILMALDECASLGTIDIKEPLQKYRKRRIRLLILVQALTDIDINWGSNEKKSLISNFKYRVCLEASEPDEQEYWARMVGNNKNLYKSVTKDTLTISEHKDYIIEPSELENMGNKFLLRYTGGYEILKKKPYYQL